MNIYNCFLKSEKCKATAAVALVVISLALAFFFEGIKLHNRTIEQSLLKTERTVSSTLGDIDLYSFTPYKQRLNNLLTIHKGVPKALYDRDRDKLYDLTLPLYESLKRENKYLQIMHFHLPDGHSFLRMHNRQKFGDDLKKIRPAIQHVHKKRTPLTGYEIGIYGAFYRIIQPVFQQGSYAGALEVGIRAHTILESLEKLIPDPMTTFYLTDRWQKITKPSKHKTLVFGKYTLNTHDDPFYDHLPPDVDLLRDNQLITINSKPYYLHSYPVFNDFQGETIGGFIVLQDISQELSAKKYFIFQAIILSSFLLAGSLIILHLTFSKLLGKLEISNSQLQETADQLGEEVEERKQQEVQLSGSKKEWERTFNAIGDLVTVMNSKLQIVKANHAAYKILKAEPGSLQGKFCYEVFSNRQSACDGCPAFETIRDYQVYSAEIEHQSIGKKFLITTSPVPDENGEFTNIVHIAKDITEKKALEVQLRQAQKMEAIGTLAGGIAHDFNNILTAIYGYTQLAMMAAKDDEEMIKDLKQIDEAAKRAKALVTQILTFSRQSDPEKRPLQISLFVKEALKLLRSSIPASIEIKQNINSQGTTLADSTQIHQIIMNLATNAAHAMETGGILGVSVHDVTIGKNGTLSEVEITPGKYICIEISDTGCGIDEQTKEKIFEPYFTTKELGKGTGLGLAVVHGIITSYSGHINVSSKLGQGTTFHIYLPTLKEEPQDFSPQADEEYVRGGNERIMFIDDEENIVNLASKFLPIYGYKATTFTDVVLAIQEFEGHPDQYDLVITDMSMPKMNGLQLAQKIKKIRPAIPIILCSGYSEIIIKEKALPMGIAKYIQKPLEMDSLARNIRELLDLNK